MWKCEVEQKSATSQPNLITAAIPRIPNSDHVVTLNLGVTTQTKRHVEEQLHLFLWNDFLSRSPASPTLFLRVPLCKEVLPGAVGPVTDGLRVPLTPSDPHLPLKRLR